MHLILPTRRDRTGLIAHGSDASEFNGPEILAALAVGPHNLLDPLSLQASRLPIDSGLRFPRPSPSRLVRPDDGCGDFDSVRDA